ncbi:ATP synthase subunit I [Psychrobacter sp. TAE2020]|uniref:ATP synthase subunit I n=1 Tax=Psychrobacter sp. TAE2020 TaxID=2846762 RepID=UPI001C118D88|nr:ATP synthase subunit I [Psychrobacter sp. TAE2020]MBU5617293.1 ATP synthase subunit I [Psychrobacter sp. TAE2020]
MTQPAKRSQKQQIRVYLKRQTWALLLVIVAAWLIDNSWFNGELVVAKSAAIGGLLSFMTQMVFAVFMFSHSGYQARNRIVSQFFRGQALKWLLTVFGFAFIFITIKPLSAPALLLGFIVMKISHVLMLGRIR